ncbi:hypothetical protein ABLE91_06400 [Aquabacter sp. CN5-332]|uniref:hypothetical protein n=1 Tax=Aquabacter sp. CN5-332 TaxID=3156608 RepID=UPI0032B350BB
MMVRTALAWAFAAISAFAVSQSAFAQAVAVPAPMMLGRWVMAPGGTAPTGDALKKLCAAPRTYIEVTPPTIREVTPKAKIACDMPAWTQTGPGRFSARMAACTPAPKAGGKEVTVELKGMALMLYNGTLFAMCPTGP